MSFATLAIAALLSSAAANPTSPSSEQQPNSAESHSTMTEQQSAPKAQRPSCCDHMDSCTGMHETKDTRAVDGASYTISHSGP